MQFIIGLIIGIIASRLFKKKPKSPDQILKTTDKFRYVYEDREVIVYVDDRYYYESKIVEKPIKKKHQPQQQQQFEPEDFIKFKNKKIEKQYLYPRKDLEDTSHILYGKKIVITGVFENFYTKNAIAKLLWEVGADVDTNIGKYTQVLLCGKHEVGPVKIEKAKSQNIEIMTEDDFMVLFPKD